MSQRRPATTIDDVLSQFGQLSGSVRTRFHAEAAASGSR